MLINKHRSVEFSIVTILELLLNTGMIWMIFLKILKNSIQIKNEKHLSNDDNRR